MTTIVEAQEMAHDTELTKQCVRQALANLGGEIFAILHLHQVAPQRYFESRWGDGDPMVRLEEIHRSIGLVLGSFDGFWTGRRDDVCLLFLIGYDLARKTIERDAASFHVQTVPTF